MTDSRFVSIDIETTGLDEETCQTIEIAAVIDDLFSPLENPPKFHCYVTHPVYKGEPYALSMHSKIFRRIAIWDEGYLYLKPQLVYYNLRNFLMEEFQRGRPFTVAGKNYANFDDRFLRKLPNWNNELFRHRVLDPGNLYWDPSLDGVELPNLETCLQRAGLPDVVTHEALEDAEQVAKLIQIAVENKLWTP